MDFFLLLCCELIHMYTYTNTKILSHIPKTKFLKMAENLRLSRNFYQGGSSVFIIILASKIRISLTINYTHQQDRWGYILSSHVA